MKRFTKATTGGLAALALTVAATVSACSDGSAASSNPTSSDVGDSNSVSSDVQDQSTTQSANSAKDQGNSGSGSPATSSAELSIENAIDIALEKVPGTVISVELDDHKGSSVWEVKVRAQDDSGTELYIDRISGEVLRQNAEKLDDEELADPKLSIVEAIAKIQEVEPGMIVEIALDKERRTLVWEAKVHNASGNRMEVQLDADTGEVLRVEVD